MRMRPAHRSLHCLAGTDGHQSDSPRAVSLADALRSGKETHPPGADIEKLRLVKLDL
jgi:hypothetical protein